MENTKAKQNRLFTARVFLMKHRLRLALLAMTTI